MGGPENNTKKREREKSSIDVDVFVCRFFGECDYVE